jgi:Tol biopolymer transport system component
LLAAGPGHVSWSPGKRILYQRPGNRNFHLVDPATEEERPLVSDDSVGWMFGPRFAPSGDSVAVRWNRPPKAELFVVPLGDKQPLRIAGSDWTPAAWSSDGQWIYAFDVRDGRFAIIRSDGTGIRELGTLTPGKRSAYSVDVHGSHIVFSFGQVQSDVWIIDNFDPASR